MKLIHVTDLHLVAPGARVNGLDPLARLEAAVADINRRHGDAALVVFSGDLADDGSPAAYAALAAALARLAPPVRLMIGNHDDREAFRAAFPREPAEAGYVQSVADTAAGRLVFLDTVDAGAVDGWLSDDRLAWLDARLAEIAGSALVFMHHPPFPIGMPPLDGIGLRNAAAFADLVARRGNVRHIFAGHVHRLCAGLWRGIPFATGRSTNHQSDALFDAAGFADSFEAPTYNVILLDGGDIAVHAHEFLPA